MKANTKLRLRRICSTAALVAAGLLLVIRPVCDCPSHLLVSAAIAGIAFIVGQRWSRWCGAAIVVLALALAGWERMNQLHMQSEMRRIQQLHNTDQPKKSAKKADGQRD
jgi:hypothetical protein